MKKTILASASMLALSVAVPAFAQNNSDVVQTGTGNGAAVAQTGANTSDIDQVGDGNAADVTQGGTANTSTVDQQSLGASATVSQTGDTNTSVVTQRDANAAPAGVSDPTALVTQAGSMNASTIAQTAGGDATLLDAAVHAAEAKARDGVADRCWQHLRYNAGCCWCRRCHRRSFGDGDAG